MIIRLIRQSRLHLLLGLMLLMTPAISIQAQQTAARPDRGLMPGASYSVSDFENISLTSGNLNMSIPLASLPPIAGGKLKFTLSAVYNSKLWNVTRTENQLGTFNNCANWVVDQPQLSDRGGWQITGGYSIQIREGVEDFYYAVPDPLPDSCETSSYENNALRNYNWYRVVLITPDGAEHDLRPVDNSNTYQGQRGYLYGYYRDTFNTLNTPMRYYTYDGTFISAVINPSGYSTYFTLTLNDGTKVVQGYDGVQRITDTNGNSIKIFGDTNGVAHYQDEQTGREIKYSYDASGNNNQGQGEVEYQTVGGTWETVTINFGATGVKGKLYKINDWDIEGGELGNGAPCSYYNVLGNDEYPVTVPVIREIIYPATEPSTAPPKFTFAYNSDSTTSNVSDTVRWWCGATPQTYTRTVSNGMGELSQVTTPTGATVDYTYSQDGTHNFYPLEGNNDIARNIITEKEVTHDGGSETWTYQIYPSNACGGIVTGPDGSVTTESCHPNDPAFGQAYGSGAFSGLTFRSVRSGKERIDRHWTSLVFSGGYQHAVGSQYSLGNFNPVVDAEYLSLLDSSGNPIKMSAKTFQYDYNGNVIETKEYDWFDPASVTFDSGGVPTGVPSGATLLRTTTNSHYNAATSSSSSNVYAKRSLTYGTPLILNALKDTTTGDAVAQLSYDGNSYGTAPTVGNLTSKSVYNDVEDDWVTTSTTYNSYGNPTSVTDGRGKVTYFYYDDYTYALPTRVVVNPDNGTGSQTTTTAYDYSTGLVTSTTDPNNAVTTIDYTNQRLNAVDPFGRPGIIIGPDLGSGVNHRTRTLYWDDSRMVQTLADLNSEGDGLLKTEVLSDELGRVIESRQYENSTDFIAVLKSYDVENRISKTSNPFRAGGSVLWTTAVADVLGRVVSVTTPDDAEVETAYDANFTTVTDQAGKVRRSMVDGLGRLVRVDEPNSSGSLGTTASPNQPTSYAYDVYGNLSTVTHGSQTRTFTYDSLSRLRTAANPESGTITYTYDNNGNLLTKVDARSITTTYVYDSINRATSRSYSDGTPTVTYSYDTATNGKGRLASLSSSVSVTNYTTYDAAGRLTAGSQVTDSQTYSMSYGYNLAGGRTSMTYPSGRVITSDYDSAGRLAGVRDQSSGVYYAGAAATDATNRMQYSAHGVVSVMKLGNGLWEHTNFNNRLQPTEIGLGTSSTSTSVVGLTYSYGTTTNNGNVLSVSYSGGGLSYTQNFGYDALNRLTTSNENSGSSWSETNGYDRYGNRWIDLGGGNQSLYFNTSNRITNSGFAYDSAGNLTNDTIHTYGFDAENKIKTVDSVSDVYRYDGDGNRVRKNFSSGEKVRMVYSGGQLIAEYDLSNGTLLKEYVYGAKGLIATIEPSNGTRYTTADHLGSPRVVTNSSAGVVSRHDYLPFGVEIGSGVGGRTTGMGFSVADGVRQKFTQKERDNETGLDYSLARYYSPVQGRFTSADPILITPDRQEVPQLLNLYGYVGNNPLAYQDPTGMKRIKLGRSEADIQGDINVVSDQLAQDDITGDERKDLIQQRQDLVSELDGNRTVNAMLAALDSKGARNGLQASDFTLMTNPTSDLKELYSGKNKLTPAREQNMLADANKGDVFALVARGVSKEIFILANSTTYQAIQRGYGYFPAPVGEVKRPDFIIAGATNSRHEQYHRDVGPSERAAYTLQMRVLNQFGPRAFANKEYYKLLKSYWQNAARTEK